MILLWGLPEDPVLATVAQALEPLGVESVVLDQRHDHEASLHLEASTDSEGMLLWRTKEIPLSTVDATYVRPDAPDRTASLSHDGLDSARLHSALSFARAMLTWTEVTRALVVNRPSAMASNGSKPYQLREIAESGFCTPETLITTDPSAAIEFRQRHHDVIYKSVSGVRSKVARLSAEGIERIGDVRWCPTQFQRYIPGREYRVHVVGDEVYACEIASDAVDYRYAGSEDAPVEIATAAIPLDVADRCRLLTMSMGLHVAGLDLRHGTDGNWYCFEVNPSPGFSYYETQTGQPIADAVARLLASRGDRAATATIFRAGNRRPSWS